MDVKSAQQEISPLDRSSPSKKSHILRDLIAFVKYPDQNRSGLEPRLKIKRTLQLYLYKVLITSSLVLLINSFLSIENAGVANFKANNTPLMVLLYGALLTPLVEELLFRLSLTPKPVYLAITGGLFTLYIISTGFYDIPLFRVDSSFPLRLGLSLIVGFSVFYWVKKHTNRMERVWSLNFRWILYLSAFGFGFMHSSNYETTALVLLAILTFPHCISGLFFGFVRVRYGFRYSLLFHSINNFVALSLIIFLQP